MRISEAITKIGGAIESCEAQMNSTNSETAAACLACMIITYNDVLEILQEIDDDC